MKHRWTSGWMRLSLSLSLSCQVFCALAQSNLPELARHVAPVEPTPHAITQIPGLAHAHARRSAEIVLNLQPLQAPTSRLGSRGERRFLVGGSGRLQLFPGESIEVEGLRVEEGSGGASTWVGDVVWPEPGVIAFTQSGSTIVGSIDVGLKRYSIRSGRDGRSYISELEPDGYGICANDDHIEAPTSKSLAPWPKLPASTGAVKASSSRTVDLMILYSPAVASAYGGEPTVLASNFVAGLNQSFVDSGIDAAVRIVHFAPASMTGEPSSKDDFTNTAGAMRLGSATAPYVGGGQGSFITLPALRDQKAADLVALLVQPPPGAVGQPSSEVCGVAPGLTAGVSDPQTQRFAFAVIAANCGIGDLTFTHEIGHLLGGKHDQQSFRETSPPSVVPSSVYPFSYGYVNTAAPFRTLMGSSKLSASQPCTVSGGCPRINRWSDTDATYFVNGAAYALGSLDPNHFSNMKLTINGGTATGISGYYPGTIPAVTSHRVPSGAAPGMPGAISPYDCKTGLHYPMSWGVASGNVGWYEVEESSHSNFAASIERYRGSQNSVTVQVKLGSTLYYRARACNGVGCSSFTTAGPFQHISCPK